MGNCIVEELWREWSVWAQFSRGVPGKGVFSCSFIRRWLIHHSLFNLPFLSFLHYHFIGFSPFGDSSNFRILTTFQRNVNYFIIELSSEQKKILGLVVYTPFWKTMNWKKMDLNVFCQIFCCAIHGYLLFLKTDIYMFIFVDYILIFILHLASLF